MATELGEGIVSGSLLIPKLTNDLILTHTTQLGDLGKTIVSNAITEVAKYGRQLREEDFTSLAAVACVIEATVLGTAKPHLYLSTQPTGWGKTAILVAATLAILNDPTLGHIGIVVMVNTLDQIDALIARMGLRDHQYAVRVGDDEPDMNERGLTSLCKTMGAKKVAHRYAPVLFTTQQKITKALMPHQRDFERMPFFDYCGPASPDEIETLKRKKSCGQKRQVRLWDEAYLPIDPVIIGLDEIASFANRLDDLGLTKAAATLKGWIIRLRNIKPKSAGVPDWVREAMWPDGEVNELFARLSEGDKRWAAMCGALFALRGTSVRVLHQQYNNTTVAISYRRSIPYNIEPLLIFDASGNQAMEYKFLARNGGNVVRLPSASKTYRNLNVRFFDYKSGQAAYRTTATIDVLATAAAQAVMDKPSDQDVLIVHRKGEKAPATTLPASIQSKVRAMGGNENRVHFLTWGNHRATNEYQQIKHVILVGVLQAPPSAVIGMVYGTSGKPMHRTVNPMDIETMRMSRIIGDAVQAIGRGALRQMTADGDVPKGCTVDVIASSKGPMGFKEPLNTLATMFPGSTVKAWHPNVPAAKPNMDVLVADAALSILEGKSEVLVTSGDWATQAGYSVRTLQRVINRASIFSALREHDITAQKQGQKWLLRKVNDSEQLRAA